jgi:hypothetical protein
VTLLALCDVGGKGFDLSGVIAERMGFEIYYQNSN